MARSTPQNGAGWIAGNRTSRRHGDHRSHARRFAADPANKKGTLPRPQLPGLSEARAAADDHAHPPSDRRDTKRDETFRMGRG